MTATHTINSEAADAVKHQQFLEFLCLTGEEIEQIRQRARRYSS